MFEYDNEATQALSVLNVNYIVETQSLVYQFFKGLDTITSGMIPDINKVVHLLKLSIIEDRDQCK